MNLKKRWKRSRKAQPDDYNVVNQKVPWYTTLIRFFTIKSDENAKR